MRNRILFIVIAIVIMTVQSCSKPEVNPYWGNGVEFIEIFEDPEIFNDSDGFKRNGWGGNIMVALDGTVLTDRRSEDGGKTWGEKIPHLAGDGRVLDEATGDIINLHSGYQPEPLPVQYRSRDHGKTWHEETVIRKRDINGWIPMTSACEEGITLRYGKHKGRLLMAARVMVEYASARDLYEQHYSSAIYSDDGGMTWHASAPFPVAGTGEAALVELSDGRIYYNSRNHNRQGNRSIAWSYDGGETWQDHEICSYLPDGPPDFYGNKGGLVRLELDNYDILIFSMTDDPGGSPDRHTTAGRENITVWASFDGGKTWPVRRWVHERGGYSHLAAGRPGTPSEGMIYLTTSSFYSRFNLAWITQGRDWREFLPE